VAYLLEVPLERGSDEVLVFEVDRSEISGDLAGGVPPPEAATGLLLPERFSRCRPQPGYRSGYDQG